MLLRAHLLKSLAILAFLIPVASASTLAQSPGPSYRDIAVRHLSSGNYDSARMFYHKWLEADPGDQTSWYNLACVESLSGNSEAGLHAFEMAVAAGWDDIAHSKRDSDLDPIRDDPRFDAALDSMEANSRARGPDGYRRHFLPLKSAGTYIALLPPDYEESGKDYPLCIILHGSGSTELGHGRIADRLGREGVIYIVPRAPFPHEQVAQASGSLGYTAWPPEEIDSADSMKKQVPHHYVTWIMSCAEDARSRYRVGDANAIILGHSQGAAFAWNTAVSFPSHIRSIFSYAGYYLDDFRTDRQLRNIRSNGVEITLCHGEADRVVDISETMMLDSLLSEWDIDHTTITVPETGHGISDGVYDAMSSWIDRYRLPVDDRN